MKRFLILILALALCCAGCGGTVPLETENCAPAITIGALEEARDFGGFTGGPCADSGPGEQLVRQVLEQYPAGFAAQWGRVEILLCGGLTGTGDFSGGSWAGFTQRVGDGWLMVLDADRCDAGTVHHEIAHILDGILTQAGALTEEAWMDLCPGGFVYGRTGDYPDFFTDAYAMTDIREDRARIFEDAVLYGPGIYEARPALWLKLEYFCRAIREHFDTDGWPEKTFWERALE